MTTNVIYISILLCVSALLYFIVSKSNTKKKQHKPNKLPRLRTVEEHVFIGIINEYRIDNNKSILLRNVELDCFADDRTKFWQDNNYKKGMNLHDLVGLHQRPYLNNALAAIAENTGITAYPFTAFKNSIEHDQNMLREDWDYISVSFKTYKNDVNYVCLAFGKKATKQTWFK